MTRARTLLVTVVLALGVLATAGQAWVSGTVSEAVLGSARVQATGSEAAPGLVALALTVVAAVVAGLVTRRWVARASFVTGALAAAGAAALAGLVLADPAGILGPIAAKAVGRADSLPVAAAVTPWPYAAGVAAVLLGFLCAWAVRSSGSWAENARAYDREDDVAGARGQRVRSEWDQLSAGHDPTDVPDENQT